MTITFPNSTLFTNYPITTTKFDLTKRQSVSRQANGTPIVSDFGLPIWTCAFTTPQIPIYTCMEILALLNSMDGAINQITAWDTRREYPQAYKSNINADTGAISAWGGSGKSVSLSGVNAGFIITLGDYFRFDFGGKRYLVQAMESITADGSGNVGDFEIRPHYPTGASGTPGVFFNKPGMRFLLDPTTVSFNDAGGLLGTVSFSGFQTF